MSHSAMHPRRKTLGRDPVNQRFTELFVAGRVQLPHPEASLISTKEISQAHRPCQKQHTDCYNRIPLALIPPSSNFLNFLEYFKNILRSHLLDLELK